jgi:non-ribosomal peptide synthetase component E (peptide arylation enzyme)
MVGDDVPEGTISLNEIMHRDLEDKYPPDYLQSIRFKPYEVTRIFNTSGTTGVPKCVERPVAPRILAGKTLTERMKITGDDIIMASWNLGAGVTLFMTQISSPLTGAKLITLEHFTPSVACEVIEREKVSVLTLVPAQMALLLEYPELDKHDFSSLRVIFTGTQFLTPELGARIEEKLGCPIVIVYGAGDTSAISSTSIDDSQEVRLKTVGCLMEGNEVEIVDSDGNPVPGGKIGEVRVTGPNLVSGYFGNPELTRQVWHDGWYSTGDAGKIDEDGHLVLMGRKRDVINRGGQNIYPVEIEELLMQHPKVSNVAIVRMPDPVMVEKQCAYVIPKRGQTFTADEMASFLQSKKVANYKLPERLEIMEEFPLVAAGIKVDKMRLEEDIAQKLNQEAPGQS